MATGQYPNRVSVTKLQKSTDARNSKSQLRSDERPKDIPKLIGPLIASGTATFQIRLIQAAASATARYTVRPAATMVMISTTNAAYKYRGWKTVRLRGLSYRALNVSMSAGAISAETSSFRSALDAARRIHTLMISSTALPTSLSSACGRKHNGKAARARALACRDTQQSLAKKLAPSLPSHPNQPRFS